MPTAADGLESVFRHALPQPDWPRRAQAGVVVGLARLPAWQPWLGQAWALLDAAQRQRAQRQRRPADRDALALSYALHRLLLGGALDLAAADVPLLRDPLGCPRIAGGRMRTSLSHAGDAVAIAAARAPVGVDLEHAWRGPELPGIAQRVCHPSELAQLQRLQPPAREAWLLELWVRKEAFLKAEGVGLTREMSDLALDGADAVASTHLAGTRLQVGMIATGDDAEVLAVAACPGEPIHFARLDPVA